MTAQGGSHSFYEAHSTRSILAGVVKLPGIKVEARIIVEPDVDTNLTQRQRDASATKAVNAARKLASEFAALITPKDSQ